VAGPRKPHVVYHLARPGAGELVPVRNSTSPDRSEGVFHLVRVAAVRVAAHGDRIVFLTGPGKLKARNLRRDPRMALSIAPIDNPFTPVVIRGWVVEWLEGDAAWEIIDQLSMKYTGAPYSREQERVVAVIEPERQRVGVG
jgi:Pyridoxamine 5'-phosphate oxidase